MTTDAVREEIQWERDIIDEVEELRYWSVILNQLMFIMMCIYILFREDFDNANRQAVSEYHEQLAEWKIYEKRRVRPQCHCLL